MKNRQVGRSDSLGTEDAGRMSDESSGRSGSEEPSGSMNSKSCS